MWPSSVAVSQYSEPEKPRHLARDFARIVPSYKSSFYASNRNTGVNSPSGITAVTIAIPTVNAGPMLKTA